MKLHGVKISGPNVEVVVLPRGDGRNLVFRASAVLDFEPFDKLCPPPKPPVVIRPGGVKSFNVEDPRFVEAMNDYSTKRTSWLIITSLRHGTPELEWETVDFASPGTWENYSSEMKHAGLTDSEIVRIVRAVMSANALDDEKLERARADFLAGRGDQHGRSSSPMDEPSDTPSGDLASDSV